MIKTSLTLRKLVPRCSTPEVVWGCVWCISSLIQTEGQDVVHKQGRGWRHIICVFWTVLAFQFGLDMGARGLTTLITVQFHSGHFPRHHYKDDNFWSEIQTAKLESRLCRQNFLLHQFKFLRASHFVKEAQDISSKPASHPKHYVRFIVNAKLHLKNEQNADRTVSAQKKRSDHKNLQMLTSARNVLPMRKSQLVWHLKHIEKWCSLNTLNEGS